METLATTNLERYIIDQINSENYDVVTTTDKEKLQFLADTFNSEYKWSIERYGATKAMNEYLPGLPSCITIEYRNHAILELGYLLNMIVANPTEKAEDHFIENWFYYIAVTIIKLFDKHDIKY